ncbi:MAG: metallophosphoesterase [Dehalococcoidia bacterium]|nr:metallophosphoesterase [Dehalococcoidia bacterium]
MRLAFATDFHGSQKHYSQFLDHTRNERVDMAIVGGDLFPIARPYEEMLRVQKQFAREILPALLLSHRALGGCPIYLMPGNNDWHDAFLDLAKLDLAGLVASAKPERIGIAGGYVLLTMPFVPPTPFGMKDFDRRDLAIEPCPGEPNPVFYSEAGEIRQADIGTYLSQRPSIEEEIENLGIGTPDAEKCICIMHSPPFRTGLDRTAEGLDVGSKAIRAAITKHQPLLTLHGHIHEAPKVTGNFACRVGRTISVNPGQRIKVMFAVIIDLDRPVVLRHTTMGELTSDQLAQAWNAAQ